MPPPGESPEINLRLPSISKKGRESSFSGAWPATARSERKKTIDNLSGDHMLTTTQVKSRVSSIWQTKPQKKASEIDDISKVMLHSLRNRRGTLYEQMDLYMEKLQREQSLEGKGGTFKTFDKFTGQVVEQKKETVPNREQLVKKKYKEFYSQPEKVDQAEQLAARLPMKQQTTLAIQSLHRKHKDSLKVMLSRQMLPDEVAVKRATVSYEMEVHDMIGHLEGDTRELSLIRILRAATDSVLYNEAEKLADVELGRFINKVLPESISRIQVLEMTLDNYRHAHVPAPPRHLVETTGQGGGSGLGGSGGQPRLQRRSSFAHKGGIHAMLNRKDTAQTNLQTSYPSPSKARRMPSLKNLFDEGGEFTPQTMTPFDRTPLGQTIDTSSKSEAPSSKGMTPLEIG